MAEKETAYRSAVPEVVAGWHEWLHRCKMIAKKRADLTDSLGRNAYVNKGMGHGSTRIVGFERFDSDKDGDLLADGALIVSTKRGQHNGLIVPNLKRKSGKDYDRHLREYDSPGLELPGLCTFHVYMSGGNMYAGGPVMWEWDGVIYALWQCDDAPMGEHWEPVPMSTYYLAKEQRDADAADNT